MSSLNTVECYQPDTDTWTTITPMQKHRSAGGVIGFEGYVYALGGHDGLSIFDSVSFSQCLSCISFQSNIKIGSY